MFWSFVYPWRCHSTGYACPAHTVITGNSHDATIFLLRAYMGIPAATGQCPVLSTAYIHSGSARYRRVMHRPVQLCRYGILEQEGMGKCRCCADDNGKQHEKRVLSRQTSCMPKYEKQEVFLHSTGIWF